MHSLPAGSKAGYPRSVSDDHSIRRASSHRSAAAKAGLRPAARAIRDALVRPTGKTSAYRRCPRRRQRTR